MLIPVPSRLLQAIQGFSKMANFARGVGSMVARRLLHEDLLSFSEFSIEVCALDVNLMEFHVLSQP
jgi:hypothetical protein